MTLHTSFVCLIGFSAVFGFYPWFCFIILSANKPTNGKLDQLRCDVIYIYISIVQD